MLGLGGKDQHQGIGVIVGVEGLRVGEGGGGARDGGRVVHVRRIEKTDLRLGRGSGEEGTAEAGETGLPEAAGADTDGGRVHGLGSVRVGLV